MDVRDKVALITGASGGIGEALARELHAAGAEVVLFARREHELRRVLGDLGEERAMMVVGDVRKPEDLRRGVEATVQRFGRLDILVNNAGVGVVGSLTEMPAELLEEAWRVNVLGPILGVQVALPALRRTGGLIVNISSGQSSRPTPRLAAYGSTKAALNLVSDTLRTELASQGIRVLTVQPGIVFNDFVAHARYTDPEWEENRRRWAEEQRARGGRTSQDAARDILQAIRDDLEEYRYDPQAATA